MAPVRPYRFVGGPWHGEFRGMDGRREWFVPIREERNYAVLADDIAYTGVKVAVYRRDGDYEAEWFYRFDRIERR